jgi:2-iminobutanoate/2-iminopropanoate deaminase
VGVPHMVQSNEMPSPAGHYSHGVAYAGLLYISGQLGRTAHMTEESAGDITAQTRRALEGIATVARAAGSDLSKLLKVNVYVTDVAHWQAVNVEYARVLGKHRPARTVIPVGPLHHGALIEIDAIVALDHDPPAAR